MKKQNDIQLLVEDIMLSASGSFGGEMTRKGDSKLVTEIQKYFKKHKVELQSVAENGDMVTIKGRLTLSKSKNLQQQFQRESAKAIIYDFKYEFEKWAIDMFKTPNVSLAGIKVNSDDVVDFAFVMIYPNKGNLKESKQALKENSQNLLEAEETETIEVVPEKNPKVAALIETSLNKAMKEWDRISADIKHKEDMFRIMIEKELASKKELEEKILAGLKYLDVKTKKVDSIVAKWKVGYTRQVDASPSQLWAAALTKVNEATRNVLLQMQKDMKKTAETPESFSISREKPEVVTEGIGSSIKDLLVRLKNWFLSLKDFGKSVDELEKVAV